MILIFDSNNLCRDICKTIFVILEVQFHHEGGLSESRYLELFFSGWPIFSPCQKSALTEAPFRVRKSENFPGSKIFHAKTFRIKRVSRDIFDFATNVRKTCQFHVFLENVNKIGKKKSKTCKEMI